MLLEGEIAALLVALGCDEALYTAVDRLYGADAGRGAVGVVQDLHVERDQDGEYEHSVKVRHVERRPQAACRNNIQ